MQRLTLNGAWQLIQASNPAEPLPAAVPGCVHLDLLRAGRIPDPNFRDHEKDQFWVAETDWTYRRLFRVGAAILRHERVLLRCFGLDTLAAVTVNGVEIGRADNMYRTWEFDVKGNLRPGQNELAVAFQAPMPYLRRVEAERGVLPAWSVGAHRLNSSAWLRKEPCSFGWDWGPQLPSSGIWRNIELLAFSTARLDGLLVLQDHAEPGRVRLTVQAGVETVSAGAPGLAAECTLSFEGKILAQVPMQPGPDGFTAGLVVEEPRLWWPNGLGDRPLYELTVRLAGPRGEVLDETSRRVGLRTLRLETPADEWGQAFRFSVNGRPFFAKGANWIPADPFPSRLQESDYRRLVAAAADANFNMLRVWGGGIYEADVFYDLCDEYGLCVWQDFMFACGTYPAFDKTWMASVSAEAADNVRRLRHHACLVLWCGNNELEQGLVGPEWTEKTMSWADYDRLFNDLLPGVVRSLDPQRDYWPGSPHSPLDRTDWSDPSNGDTHLWGVWHGRRPFEWYRTCAHRFVSEFGFQSFPEPDTVAAFTLPADRNLTGYVMEYHQRSGIGNSTIVHYLLDWFRLPDSFDGWLWLSQIQQGMAMKYAVEHWRRGMPRTMGALYWQLNDLWPAPSWSSIDVFGRWKALHYLARRFFAPRLVSGVEDLESGTVAVSVTQDGPDFPELEVRWSLTGLDGHEVRAGQVPVPPFDAPASRTVARLGLAPELERFGPRGLLLWLELYRGAELESHDLVLFARPKHLDLPDPGLACEVRPGGEGLYHVALRAGRPALWCWLTLNEKAPVSGGITYGDNFFHLRPGQEKTVTLRLDPPGPLAAEDLRVRSLVDTYGGGVRPEAGA